MSLFGGLYVGKSGLQSSQNALNTVAHNLSNVGTTGYVRQQVAKTDIGYTTISSTPAVAKTQIGDGVQYSECRHIRDSFLDSTYREDSGRSSFYELSYSAIMEIEDILGELDGAAFANAYDGIWSAFEELSKDPSDATNISLLVSKSASLIENASSVYQSMIEYQSNLNTQIKDMVNSINAIGDRIDELNKEIAKIECGGVEHANDLRDERDLLLDTLAGYGNITYAEDLTGKLSVRFDNNDFITDAGVYHIEMRQDYDTGFYQPYWPQNVKWTTDLNGEKIADYSVANIFNLTTEISTDMDTDVGALRALLLARGDHVANYTDLDTSICTQQKLDALGITREQYEKNPTAYGTIYYDKYIKNSVIMNIEAEFDNLVHAITTTINQVLADNCDTKSGYLCNADGTPIQMFQKAMSDPYEKISVTSEATADARIANGEKLYKIYDDNGNYTGECWKFIEETGDTTQSLYNCASLKINQELVQTPVKLGYVMEDDSSDFRIGKAFLEAFEAKSLYLNPNATKESSFRNCYEDLVGQVGTSGDVYKYLYECQQLAVQQTEENRQTVIGVSSDDELEHMIMYQNAYNAASRYINVINSLLESVINMAQ